MTDWFKVLDFTVIQCLQTISFWEHRILILLWSEQVAVFSCRQMGVVLFSNVSYTDFQVSHNTVCC
jgi:hypothetical protein